MSEEPNVGAPLVVGLLGGVASGKSTVAGLFAEMGAMVIDADSLAGEVLEGPEGREAVRRVFGDAAMGRAGEVDREALSEIVFGEAPKLKKLMDIVHPAVAARIRSLLGGMGGKDIAVLDIPLLAESAFLGDCDLLVFIDAPLSVRQRRAVDARGWAEGEVLRREGHQAPLEEKRKRADLIVRNHGTLEDVRREAVRAWNAIRDRGARERGSGPSPSPADGARPAEDTKRPKEAEDG